jgi:hypothetical protein
MFQVDPLLALIPGTSHPNCGLIEQPQLLFNPVIPTGYRLSVQRAALKHKRLAGHGNIHAPQVFIY